MAKKVNIRIRSTVHPTSNGTIRVRTTTSVGNVTRTSTKTIKSK